MAQAMSIRVGNPIRKLVLIKLADNANDKGECWPSYQHIADQCEIGRSTVKSHIKALEEMGLVRREFRKNGVLNQSNLYHLTLDKSSDEFFNDPGAKKKAVQNRGQKRDSGVGQDLTGVGQELPGGGSGAAPGGGAGADPRTSHSFEPVIEPKNNTHIAGSIFAPVDNSAIVSTPDYDGPHCRFGGGGKQVTRSSSGQSEHRRAQATDRNSNLPEVTERIKNQIALNHGPSRMRQTLSVCQNANLPGHCSNKFAMFAGWLPSNGLREVASKIGIQLVGLPDSAILANFVAFWEADGAAYNQTQWEMKLARYAAKGRKKPAKKRAGEQRDCTMVGNMDYAIPEGFRGE